MPRRRNTRNVKSSRPKPKAPRGSEGAELSEEERQEKLDLLLRDFDMEVASRRKKMLEYGEDIIKQIHSLYSMEIMKLPKDVRNMCIGDLMKEGTSGLDKSGMEPDPEPLVDQFTSSLDNRIKATIKKTRAAQPMETITETGEDQPEGKASKRRGRFRPVLHEKQNTANRPKRSVKHSSLRNKLAAPDPTPEPAATSTRSSRALRRLQETPSMRGGPSRAGWETPLVTPKFDPRLPMTPAGARRKAKPGEAISFVSMCVPVSMTGSPLAVDEHRGPSDKLLAMPVGSKVIQLPITRGIDRTEAQSVFGELNEMSRENLVNLRENVNKILESIIID